MFSFIHREARWLGAGFLLTFFSGFGQTYFISLSNDALMARFGLSDGGISLVYAAATLTSAAILVEFGKIVDRVSTRNAALIVTAGLALACLMMSAAIGIWMLFLGIVGLRLFGQGMMSHIAMTATGRWFEASRGRAVSLVALGHPASEAVMPPLAIAAMIALGLQPLWMIGASVLVVLALPMMFILLYRERVPKNPGSASLQEKLVSKSSWSRRHVLGEPSFYFIMLGVQSAPFMVTGLFFHQQHLLSLKMEWTVGLWAAGFTSFALAQVVSSLVCGALIDRFSARALMPFYLLPLAFGLLIPALASGGWAVFALMIMLGLTGGAATALMGALWPEIFGLRYLGELRAMVFATMVGATAASPVITGLLIDAGVDFTHQLAVMGVYALLASLMLAFIQPRLAAIASDTVRAFEPHS